MISVRVSTVDRLLKVTEVMAEKLTGEWMFGIGLVVVGLPIGCGLGVWAASKGIAVVLGAQ